MHKERSLCARLKTAIAILAVCAAFPAARGDRFAVPPGTPGAAPDGVFATWATATTNIQNAVNAATPGETVWVTNGVYYSTGAGMTSNSMVYIAKPITVRSVNGRDATVLNGNYPAFTNRAFHLTHTNAVVMGFTVTNCGQFAAAAQGCGMWVGWGTVTDCRIVRCGSRSVNGSGIYIHYAQINNCLSRNNRVYANGCGVWINYNGGMLNCTVSHNSHATGGNAGWVYFAGYWARAGFTRAIQLSITTATRIFPAISEAWKGPLWATRARGPRTASQVARRAVAAPGRFVLH